MIFNVVHVCIVNSHHKHSHLQLRSNNFNNYFLINVERLLTMTTGNFDITFIDCESVQHMECHVIKLAAWEVYGIGCYKGCYVNKEKCTT